MRIQFRCGCGQVNYNREDWLSHFKYSLRGKFHAFKLFLKTKVEIV
jgi:hypothetical protein